MWPQFCLLALRSELALVLRTQAVQKPLSSQLWSFDCCCRFVFWLFIWFLSSRLNSRCARRFLVFLLILLWFLGFTWLRTFKRSSSSEGPPSSSGAAADVTTVVTVGVAFRVCADTADEGCAKAVILPTLRSCWGCCRFVLKDFIWFLSSRFASGERVSWLSSRAIRGGWLFVERRYRVLIQIPHHAVVPLMLHGKFCLGDYAPGITVGGFDVGIDIFFRFREWLILICFPVVMSGWSYYLQTSWEVAFSFRVPRSWRAAVWISPSQSKIGSQVVVPTSTSWKLLYCFCMLVVNIVLILYMIPFSP